MRVRKRLRRIKRLAYLGGLVGGVFALRQAKAKRDARTNLGAPATWPPLRVAEAPVAALGDLATATVTPAGSPTDDAGTDTTGDTDTDRAAGDGEPSAHGAVWVDPDEEGACPLSHPVKANANSGIFHEPGGQFYDRTHAERCYVDAAAAEADGYRAAKSS